MKKYIKSNQRIYGMALERKVAIRHLEKYSEPLMTHILKCVIYGNSTGNLEHWIEEICNYIDYANDVTTKPNGKKMKISDYNSTIFADMGDTRKEASMMLKGFKLDNTNTQKYPQFVIDPELIDRVFNAFNMIKSSILPILTSINDMDADDFYPIIYDILR